MTRSLNVGKLDDYSFTAGARKNLGKNLTGSKHPPNGRSLDGLDRRAMLARLAARHAIHSAQPAAGRCFVASLEFANAAREVEDVVLMRWRVRNDPDFNEHWTVRLSGSEVLDVTRVQVDGKSLALKQIASYPNSYRLVGEYPASILLAYRRVGDEPVAPVSFSSALAMRRAMHRHDVRNASARKLMVRMAGWTNLSHFFLYALAGRAIELLATRRRRLVERLGKRR